MYFGFMQLGWLEDDNKSYFLKVVWMLGNSWTGDKFDCELDVGIH